MKSDDIQNIYDRTLEHFLKAKKNAPIMERAFSHAAMNEDAAISDAIPGYSANMLDFGSYTSDNFAVLFVDMRNSTKRAEKIGEVQTFLTMHAFIPAMLEVIKIYDGKVIDIMGDGIMAFFGGSKQKENKLSKAQAIDSAGKCGLGMLEVREKVVNKILNDEKIEWPHISIGVGVTYGKVIVTKIGINDIYDVKAFGDCVNKASKYSKETDKMKVSKEIKNGWPSSKGGKIRFGTEQSDGGYIVERTDK